MGLLKASFSRFHGYFLCPSGIIKFQFSGIFFWSSSTLQTNPRGFIYRVRYIPLLSRLPGLPRNYLKQFLVHKTGNFAFLAPKNLKNLFILIHVFSTKLFAHEKVSPAVRLGYVHRVSIRKKRNRNHPRGKNDHCDGRVVKRSN